MDVNQTEAYIAALLDKAEEDQKRVGAAITLLEGTSKGLQEAVKQAAVTGMQEALKGLHAGLERARDTAAQLQRFSLWRAAWQHAIVTLVTIAITLTVVRWYVPSVSEIQARRAERAQLQASIEDLARRGGRIKLNTCGNPKDPKNKERLCVLVDPTAGTFKDSQGDDTYMIAKGY